MDEKLKALIVDDEEDVCFLLSSILRNKNLQPSFVNSIGQARVALENNTEPPSIIFLDNHLPDGFGIHFIREIKQLAKGAKIIMITAHDTKADKEMAYQEGADLFIGKPFTRENILTAIDTVNVGKDIKM